MDSDLRSTLQRLAPSPKRDLDVEGLLREGRRRRRTRYIAYATTALVIVVVAGTVVPTVLRDDMSDRDAGPVQTPASPSPDPDAVTSPFEDLRPGWTKLPSAPEARGERAAMAWTGKELVVWGGYVYTGFSDEVAQSDGFKFDAASRTWEPIAPSPLAARVSPASAWTGTEMLVWGGASDRSLDDFLDDGAAYDPATDRWRQLPPAPVSARAPLHVWTGRELIVWGASAWSGEVPIDGAAYDPIEDSWRTLPDAPTGLGRATAVWTDREMIVLGDAGKGNDGSSLAPAAGVAYDPATDSWRRLADSDLSNNASTASWNGSEMIAWDYLHNTAAYDPDTDAWRSLPTVPLEDYECSPRSVALEGRVFGDYCGLSALHDPEQDSWRDISRDRFAGWGFTVIAADPVVLLIGRNVDTEEEGMFAYRPPAPREHEEPFRLLVHCGLSVPLEFDDRLWLPIDPELRRTRDPPDGFGTDENYDEGTIRVVDRDTLVYTSSEGVEVEYEPSEEGPKFCE